MNINISWTGRLCRYMVWIIRMLFIAVHCCHCAHMDAFMYSKVTGPPPLVMSSPYVCHVLYTGRPDFNCDICVWPLISRSPMSVCLSISLPLTHRHTHTHTHTHTEKNLIWVWDPGHRVDGWSDNWLAPTVISAIMINSPLQLLGGIVKVCVGGG
jgi:hypothetical protein